MSVASTKQYFILNVFLEQECFLSIFFDSQFVQHTHVYIYIYAYTYTHVFSHFLCQLFFSFVLKQGYMRQNAEDHTENCITVKNPTTVKKPNMYIDFFKLADDSLPTSSGPSPPPPQRTPSPR